MATQVATPFTPLGSPNTHFAVDIDLYGRAFDGIFGDGAEQLAREEAIRRTLKAKKERPGVEVHSNNGYVEVDLYGRGDPRIFGEPAFIETQRMNVQLARKREAVLSGAEISPQRAAVNALHIPPGFLGKLAKLAEQRDRENKDNGRSLLPEASAGNLSASSSAENLEKVLPYKVLEAIENGLHKDEQRKKKQKKSKSKSKLRHSGEEPEDSSVSRQLADSNSPQAKLSSAYSKASSSTATPSSTANTRSITGPTTPGNSKYNGPANNVNPIRLRSVTSDLPRGQFVEDMESSVMHTPAKIDPSEPRRIRSRRPNDMDRVSPPAHAGRVMQLIGSLEEHGLFSPRHSERSATSQHRQQGQQESPQQQNGEEGGVYLSPTEERIQSRSKNNVEMTPVTPLDAGDSSDSSSSSSSSSSTSGSSSTSNGSFSTSDSSSSSSDTSSDEGRRDNQAQPTSSVVPSVAVDAASPSAASAQSGTSSSDPRFASAASGSKATTPSPDGPVKRFMARRRRTSKGSSNSKHSSSSSSSSSLNHTRRTTAAKLRQGVMERVRNLFGSSRSASSSSQQLSPGVVAEGPVQQPETSNENALGRSVENENTAPSSQEQMQREVSQRSVSTPTRASQQSTSREWGHQAERMESLHRSASAYTSNLGTEESDSSAVNTNSNESSAQGGSKSSSARNTPTNETTASSAASTPAPVSASKPPKHPNSRNFRPLFGLKKWKRSTSNNSKSSSESTDFVTAHATANFKAAVEENQVREELDKSGAGPSTAVDNLNTGDATATSREPSVEVGDNRNDTGTSSAVRQVSGMAPTTVGAGTRSSATTQSSQLIDSDEVMSNTGDEESSQPAASTEVSSKNASSSSSSQVANESARPVSEMYEVVDDIVNQENVEYADEGSGNSVTQARGVNVSDSHEVSVTSNDDSAVDSDEVMPVAHVGSESAGNSTVNTNTSQGVSTSKSSSRPDNSIRSNNNEASGGGVFTMVESLPPTPQIGEQNSSSAGVSSESSRTVTDSDLSEVAPPSSSVAQTSSSSNENSRSTSRGSSSVVDSDRSSAAPSSSVVVSTSDGNVVDSDELSHNSSSS